MKISNENEVNVEHHNIGNSFRIVVDSTICLTLRGQPGFASQHAFIKYVFMSFILNVIFKSAFSKLDTSAASCMP